MTIWLIAYLDSEPWVPRGWYVIDLKGNPQAGPYGSHADAVEALDSMAWRISQGWKP